MFAIQNFGMLWEREKVEWGRGAVRGQLLGKSQKARRADPVDLRDQTGIYVLYDEQRTPIWIGQAEKIFKRLNDHRRDQLWNRWTYFTWFGFRRVNANGTLGLAERFDWGLKGNVAEARDEIEAVLIQVLEPKLNRQGSRWGDTTEYLQFYDGEEDENEEEE